MIYYELNYNETECVFYKDNEEIIRCTSRDVWGKNKKLTNKWANDVVERIDEDGIEKVRFLLTGSKIKKIPKPILAIPKKNRLEDVL